MCGRVGLRVEGIRTKNLLTSTTHSVPRTGLHLTQSPGEESVRPRVRGQNRSRTERKGSELDKRCDETRKQHSGRRLGPTEES